MKNPMIIGHRGAMGYEMENSIASIKKAVQLGAPMIEIDVFLIASGELVVFHDFELDQRSNGKGPIANYSWEALQKVTLHGGHKIPLLSEVLDLLAGKTQLNIELKGPNTATAVLALVAESVAAGRWQQKDLLISSFDWPMLFLARQINDQIPIAVLTEASPLEAIKMAETVGAVAINPYYKDIDAAIVKAIHQAGFKVFAYTVNEAADFAKMKAMGVDGIFTNYPDRKF